MRHPDEGYDSVKRLGRMSIGLQGDNLPRQRSRSAIIVVRRTTGDVELEIATILASRIDPTPDSRDIFTGMLVFRRRSFAFLYDGEVSSRGDRFRFGRNVAW